MTGISAKRSSVAMMLAAISLSMPSSATDGEEVKQDRVRDGDGRVAAPHGNELKMEVAMSDSKTKRNRGKLIAIPGDSSPKKPYEKTDAEISNVLTELAAYARGFGMPPVFPDHVGRLADYSREDPQAAINLLKMKPGIKRLAYSIYYLDQKGYRTHKGALDEYALYLTFKAALAVSNLDAEEMPSTFPSQILTLRRMGYTMGHLIVSLLTPCPEAIATGEWEPQYAYLVERAMASLVPLRAAMAAKLADLGRVLG